ncbi:unnamed protein product, partial [Lymnaea stagnalis]
MAAYLICLTSGSGLPVFTRSVGNVKPTPNDVIGSDILIIMYLDEVVSRLAFVVVPSNTLLCTLILPSLVLIAVMGRDGAADDVHMGQLLDNVFNAMVLLYGLDDLTNIKNVERFKKEIRLCFKLVDTLIQQSALSTFSDVTHAVDVMVTTEASILQSFLDTFVEAADSPYGCLIAHGRVIAATTKWWELKATELVLLSLLIVSFPQCSSRDVPIYLPHGSPTIPHRLLTFELLGQVELCVICGPTPTLVELEREVPRFWQAAVDTLRSASQTSPRNFPTSMDVDSNILGFLLVNVQSNRCLSSVNLMRERDEPAKHEKRRAVL